MACLICLAEAAKLVDLGQWFKKAGVLQESLNADADAFLQESPEPSQAHVILMPEVWLQGVQSLGH
jgi:hypothetical protein